VSIKGNEAMNLGIDFSRIWIFLIVLSIFSILAFFYNWKKIKFKKLIIGILLIPLLIFLLIVGYFTLPWVAIYVGLQLMPSPPRPEITYGKFPFSLECEINGKRIVIKDTVICEYDGIGMNEGSGKYRKWKEHLASGKERLTILKINDTQEIFYRTGYANYYMGEDQEEGITYEFSFPNADFVDEIKDRNGEFYESKITAEELLKKYHIKLISWNYTKPITQNYKKSRSKD
jgi:hypothetical protein